METATARRKKPKSWTGRRPNVGAKRLNNPTTQRCIELPVVAGRPCYKVQDMVPNEDVPILDHELWMRNEHMSTGRGSANKAQGVKALGRGGGLAARAWSAKALGSPGGAEEVTGPFETQGTHCASPCKVAISRKNTHAPIALKAWEQKWF